MWEVFAVAYFLSMPHAVVYLVMSRSKWWDLFFKQGHRIIWLGRDPWSYLLHFPAWSRSNEIRLLRAMSGWVVGISRGGDSTTSLAPVPVSDHPHGDKVFLPSNWNFPCRNSCLFPPVPSPCVFKTTLPPSSLHSPLSCRQQEAFIS